jgi:MFS family permease
MGIGNGVFHPADFAILNAHVQPRRLGHAFSTHGVGGSLGYALAPVCSYALGSAFGWRTALLVMGLAGLLLLAVLATQGRDLATEGHRGHASRNRFSGAMLLERAILLCFLFFCLNTIATVGIQTFAAPALDAAYGISMASATSAITGYLLGSTAGIVAGGFLAARTARHDRVAATGLAGGASLMLAVATMAAGAAWLVPLFALAGFALGATGPSRDMIVRAATPPGASGRTYGVVYSGLDIGATIAPVLAGTLLDHGAPRALFVGIAVALLLGLTTVMQAKAGRGSAQLASRAAD